MQNSDFGESNTKGQSHQSSGTGGEGNKKTLARKIYAHQKKVKWNRAYILKTLIDGALLVLPLAVIVFALYLLFRFVFNLLVPITLLLTPNNAEPHWFINVISLAILVTFLFIVGLAARNRSGKYYFTYFERNYLCHIPLYATVRDTVQQFTGMKSMPFSKVVLIDPFNSGTLMTGFITEEISEDIYTVFVPTAPNPTNGNIYHVPKENVKFLEVGTDKAMRTVVSMGTGSSCLFTAVEEDGKALPAEVISK